MSKKLSDVDIYRVYCKWRAGAGEFKCFFCSTNFVSLQHYPDFEFEDIASKEDLPISEYFMKIQSIIKEIKVNETFIVIDIPGKLSIQVAYELFAHKCLSPILKFNGVMHANGLIGDKEYIGKLLGLGELIEASQTKGVAFILDSDRYGDYSDQQLKMYFNNQYELGEDDFPSAEMLVKLGYSSALYVFAGDEKEDMAWYLEYLSESGIAVIKENMKENQNS